MLKIAIYFIVEPILRLVLYRMNWVGAEPGINTFFGPVNADKLVLLAVSLSSGFGLVY